MSQTLAAIAAQRVLPVLRAPGREDAIATACACASGGLRVVELTRSTPDVEDVVRALAEDAELVLGVGTITSAAEVHSAADAGAKFVVSFAHPDGFVDAAHERGLVAIPGALTPSEVLRCHQGGADAVKIFPGRAVEPAYLRDLRAVMPDLRTIVTGGVRIGAAAIGAWLDAGAIAVGVGSELGSVGDHGAAEVQRRAAAAVAAARGDGS